MDLREVGELTESRLVSERDERETVVSQSAHGSNGGGFLTTTETGSGDEEAGVLAVKTASRPLLAGLVPEGLPLGGCASASIGLPAQRALPMAVVTDGVSDLEVLRRSEDGRVGEGDVGGLGGSVHLSQDLLGESLGDSKQLALSGR